jgi:hypothetical protein
MKSPYNSLVFASASVSRPMDEKDIKVDEEEELGDLPLYHFIYSALQFIII